MNQLPSPKNRNLADDGDEVTREDLFFLLPFILIGATAVVGLFFAIFLGVDFLF